MKKKILLAFMTIVSLSAMADSGGRTPAFPGAEGYGMYVTGGRGGTVYHVTTLEDTDTEGSFRYAVKQTGARTIVFDISGTIYLTSDLGINNGDITIAGQTAPGDGVCIAGYPFTIEAQNVIIRYMRFRPGDTSEEEFDGLGGMDGANIIVDHCSISWSTDECMSVYGNRNTTVQWCMIYQSLNESTHQKGAHGYGGMMGGGKTTYHHNLIADHASRTPRFCFRSGDETSKTHPTDYRNNVIYNYGKLGCYGAEDMDINIVNNYYKPGPLTKMYNEGYQKRICGAGYGTHYDDDGNVSEYVWGHYYVEGNVNSAWSDVTNNNWTIGFINQIASGSKTATYGWNTSVTPDTIHMTEVMPFATVSTHSAKDAYLAVLNYAGASLSRDSLDRVIVSDTRNGVCTFSADATSQPGIINTQTEASTDGDNAWPLLNSAKAPADSDGDGIPDIWEDSHNLDSDNADDGAEVTSDGYTNLEHYMNSLVDDILSAQNEGSTVMGDDIASTGPLNADEDDSDCIDIPSSDPLDLTLASFTGAAEIKEVDGVNTIDNARTGNTVSFILNCTEAGYYNVAFKAACNRSDITLTFDFSDLYGVSESKNEVSITNNKSWTSFVDYSFTTTGPLTTGKKILTLTFSGEKYTTNVKEIVITLNETAGIKNAYDQQRTAGRVFSLDGRPMNKPADRLPKGVYIVNKKKYIRI